MKGEEIVSQLLLQCVAGEEGTERAGTSVKSPSTRHLSNGNSALREFFSKFAECKTSGDKIKLLEPLFKWIPPESHSKVGQLASENVDLFGRGKSWRRSRELRKEAMTTALTGKLSLATTLTNLSFAYAQNPQDIVEGHRTRLQLLNLSLELLRPPYSPFLLQKIKTAVQTLQLLSLSQNPRTVENEGKGKCEREILGELEGCLRSPWSQIANPRDGESLEKMRGFTDQMFRVHSPNLLAPACEDFVEIRRTCRMGRGLFVTKQVPIGTTLMVETPFVSLLLDPFYSKLDHCHHCLTDKMEPVPCLKCVFALFCSEKCREDAAEYHQYECAYFPEIERLGKKSGSPSSMSLAYRLISKTGPQNLFRIFQATQAQTHEITKSSVIRDQDCQRVSVGTGPKVFHPACYGSMCSLEGHSDPLDYSSPTIALALTRLLKSANFFSAPDHSQPSFQSFIAATLLEHYHRIQNNCMAIVKLELMDCQSLEDSGGQSPNRNLNLIMGGDEELLKDNINTLVGLGLYSTVSLMNHSCDCPNIILKWAPKFGQVAVLAARSLRAGEQLFNLYCPPFYDFEKGKRQAELSDKYHFKCECLACLSDWPTIHSSSALTSSMPGFWSSVRFCCSFCELGDGKSTGLNRENSFTCPHCGVSRVEEELWEQLRAHCLAIDATRKHSTVSMDTFHVVKEAIEFFNRNLFPPSKYQILAQKILDFDYMTIIRAIE